MTCFILVDLLDIHLLLETLQEYWGQFEDIFLLPGFIYGAGFIIKPINVNVFSFFIFILPDKQQDLKLFVHQ